MIIMNSNPTSPTIPSSGGLPSSNRMDKYILPDDIVSGFHEDDSCPPPPRSDESVSSYPEHLPCRRSERQKLICGICFRPAFVADGGPSIEAWILCCNSEHPSNIPICPTMIPQHLVCFRCCPLNKTGHIQPGELVEYPMLGQRPILTINEFCMDGAGAMAESFFKHYEFSTGSKVDYEAKCMYQRRVALNDFIPNHGKSSVRIKSEPSSPEITSITSWKRTTRQISKCGICLKPAFIADGRFKVEAWILCFQGEKQPTYCPNCPTSISKHLICFRYCPRDNRTVVKPDRVIEYPDMKRRPILTVNEFCEDGSYHSHCFGYYEFLTGSEVDYASLANGQALWGKAGE